MGTTSVGPAVSVRALFAFTPDLATLRLAYQQGVRHHPVLRLPASACQHFDPTQVVHWTLGNLERDARYPLTHCVWHVHHVRDEAVLAHHVTRQDPRFTWSYTSLNLDVRAGDRLVLAAPIQSGGQHSAQVLTVEISDEVNWALLSPTSMMTVDEFLDMFGSGFTAPDLDRWTTLDRLGPTRQESLTLSEFIECPEYHLMGCEEPDDDHFHSWLVRDGRVLRRDTWHEGNPLPDLGLQPGDTLFAWHVHDCAGMACAYNPRPFASRLSFT